MTKLQANDIIKTDNIITCDPDTTLKKAVAQLRSSHDAVFVINVEDTYQGVINPYQAFFNHNYPADTKAKRALFHAPKLKPATPIDEIARLMLESKVYFLPVLKPNDTLLGVVSINRILKALLENPGIVENIPPLTLTESLITIPLKSTIKDARKVMKQHQVSRLPVIGPAKKLVGIVSRRDLSQGIALPIESPNVEARMGERQNFLERPLEFVMQRHVITTTSKPTVDQVVKLMLDHDIGSVLITDQNQHPQTIITQKDLLQSLAKINPPSTHPA